MIFCLPGREAGDRRQHTERIGSEEDAGARVIALPARVVVRDVVERVCSSSF